MTLTQRMQQDGYDGYAYAYPHKTSYRPLDPPVPLEEAWQAEPKDALFLYVHLPFCEMRCGFCNLFTTVRPGGDFVSETLAAIARQSAATASCIAPACIGKAAFGGGTPSFLSAGEIAELFARLATDWPVDWHAIPVSFETSPATINAEKLRVLRDVGVDRISMGVQSFFHEDLKALGRPFVKDEIDHACATIRDAGFPIFNLDLIYGVDGQDESRWLANLERAVHWQPEELYLYPLYVRTLTGLGKRGHRPAEHRRDLYQQACAFLAAHGYHQISMRLFRRREVPPAIADYCCQEDGMIGLGPGARSYTTALHYSTEFAVGQTGVRQIIGEFNTRTDAQHRVAEYGVHLDLAEQRRRYLIKSLLRVEGLDCRTYTARFGTAVQHDFPELEQLEVLGLSTHENDLLRLNGEGLSWSDIIGPWLYSDVVHARMEACELV